MPVTRSTRSATPSPSMPPGQLYSTSTSVSSSCPDAQNVAPEPAPTPPFIGIDLGCSHSAVAVYLGNGNVEIIPNDIGNRTTPSVVAFLEPDRLVGEAAVVQAAMNPRATVRNIQRILGRSLKSILDDKVPALGSVTLVEDEVDDRPLLKLRSEQSSQHESIRPEEVAAMLLSSLKKSAEQFLKEEVPEASIAVPAYFNAAQRLAVQQSGVIAGFRRVRLVNDTSATALTFAVDRAGLRRVVVVDIGGGGGSVSVADVSLNGFVKVLATSYERIPGGDDLDAWVLADFQKEIFRDKSTHLLTERTYEILLSSWTKAKEKLIHRQQTNLKVFLPGIDNDFEKVLKWEDFREHLKPMLLSVERALEDVLTESKTLKKQVCDVLLVGGCSRIPLLRSAVRNFFDGKEPCRAVNADEGVARGAALYAASLSRDGSVESVLEDITPLAMRIRSKEGTFNVVKRNQPVPCKINQEMREVLSGTGVCFRVEQSGPPNGRIVCDVTPPSSRYSPPKFSLENVHFLSRDGLLSLGNTKYELTFRACLKDREVQGLKNKRELYFRMEDERNQRNEEKNRFENLLRDLQARQAQLDDEMEAKQLLKDLVNPAMEWFLSDQDGSTEEYRERFSSIVEILTAFEGVLPDTPEWKAYLHELNNSRDRHERSGSPEKKRPRSDDVPEPDQAETEPRRVKSVKPQSGYGLRSTGVETRQTKFTSKPQNAGKASDFQPRESKNVSKKPEDAEEPSNARSLKSKLGLKQLENAEKPLYVQPDSDKLSCGMSHPADLDSKLSEMNAGKASHDQPHEVETVSKKPGDTEKPSNAQPHQCKLSSEQSENSEKFFNVQPNLERPEMNSDKLSNAKAVSHSANLDSKLSKNACMLSHAPLHKAKNGSKQQGDADSSTKLVHHAETSEGRRQESRPGNEQGDGKERGNGESKGVGEAGAADVGHINRARVRDILEKMYNHVFTREVMSSKGAQTFYAGNDLLANRLAAEEAKVLRVLAGRVLHRVMAEVRGAGPFCLMPRTITTERGDFVAMVLRYCTPGDECTPVERLVALLDAVGVTAAALHGRFTELCNLHHVDWRSALLAVSMDAVRSTHGELQNLHGLLQREAKRAIRLVWDSSIRVGDLMAIDFEEFAPGRKFFIAVDCFRDLFRHEGRRADLARHCGVDVKALEFASYEDTIFFISEHFREVRDVVGKLKDAFGVYAVTAAHLFDCLNDRRFLDILLTFRRVFEATDLLTKRLKDSIPVGLTIDLRKIHEIFAPPATDNDDSLPDSMCRKLGDVPVSINYEHKHDGCALLMKNILRFAENTIDCQLSHCHDLFTDIDCLSQILVSGDWKILPDNFLNWVPQLQGERDREELISELNAMKPFVGGRGPCSTLSHSSILRSPIYPSVASGLRALLTLPLLPVQHSTVGKLRRCLQSGAIHVNLEASMILICASTRLYQPIDAREYDEAVDELIKTIGIL